MKFLIPNSEKLAVRIPLENKFLKKLISKVGDPIISTSLNVSGKPVLKDLSKLEETFGKNKIDLLVNISNSKKVRPSKIIDITDMDKVEIIRN